MVWRHLGTQPVVAAPPGHRVVALVAGRLGQDLAEHLVEAAAMLTVGRRVSGAMTVGPRRPVRARVGAHEHSPVTLGSLSLALGLVGLAAVIAPSD